VNVRDAADISQVYTSSIFGAEILLGKQWWKGREIRVGIDASFELAGSLNRKFCAKDTFKDIAVHHKSHG
jgi:hypothetical protein